MRKGEWFAPKRFGYGAGLPIAWQGWALLGSYLAVLFGLQALVRATHPAAFVATAVMLTAGLGVVCERHTQGGWRWRWGKD